MGEWTYHISICFCPKQVKNVLTMSAETDLPAVELKETTAMLNEAIRAKEHLMTMEFEKMWQTFMADLEYVETLPLVPYYLD